MVSAKGSHVVFKSIFKIKPMPKPKILNNTTEMISVIGFNAINITGDTSEFGLYSDFSVSKSALTVN